MSFSHGAAAKTAPGHFTFFASSPTLKLSDCSPLSMRNSTESPCTEPAAQFSKFHRRLPPIFPYGKSRCPGHVPNEIYEQHVAEVFQRAVDDNIQAIAIWRLVSSCDVRTYREKQLQPTGLEPLFPLWNIPTHELARAMINGGLRAKLVCASTPNNSTRPSLAVISIPICSTTFLPPSTPAARTRRSFTPASTMAPCSQVDRARSRRSRQSRRLHLCRFHAGPCRAPILRSTCYESSLKLAVLLDPHPAARTAVLRNQLIRSPSHSRDLWSHI